MLKKKKVLLLGGILCFVVLIVFECFLRFSAFAFHSPFFEEDVPFIFRTHVQESNFFQFDFSLFWKRPHNARGINMYGFNEKAFPVRSESLFRILVFGGSVVNGHGVPRAERYSDQLQKKCDQKFGERIIEVLNVACPGYTSFQGKRLFTRVAKKFKPDMVIIHFGENDRTRARYADKELGLAKLTGLLLARFLANNFKIVQYLMYMRYDEDSLKWKTRVLPEDYRDNIAFIDKMAKDKGIKLLFIKACLEKELREEKPGKRYIPLEPYIDLYGVLAEYKGERHDLVFMDWAHLRPLGHTLLAERIYSVLFSEGFLPEEVQYLNKE